MHGYLLSNAGKSCVLGGVYPSNTQQSTQVLPKRLAVGIEDCDTVH